MFYVEFAIYKVWMWTFLKVIKADQKQTKKQ